MTRLLILASNSAPPTLVFPALDETIKVRESRLDTISGFQSRTEADALDILLKGTQPITICPARQFDPETDRLYSGARWQAVKTGVDEGRVTIVSPPGVVGKRITRENAAKRNEYLLEIADSVLLLYATPGGETERVVNLALARGLPVSVLDHPANARWLELGATMFEIADPGV